MSQDVAENDTGTFRCRGEGIPEPTVKWLINGVAVTSKLIMPHIICKLYVNDDTNDDAIYMTQNCLVV